MRQYFGWIRHQETWGEETKNPDPTAVSLHIETRPKVQRVIFGTKRLTQKQTMTIVNYTRNWKKMVNKLGIKWANIPKFQNKSPFIKDTSIYWSLFLVSENPIYILELVHVKIFQYSNIGMNLFGQLEMNHFESYHYVVCFRPGVLPLPFQCMTHW